VNICDRHWNFVQTLDHISEFLKQHIREKDINLYSFVSAHKKILDQYIADAGKKDELYKLIIYAYMRVYDTHMEHEKYMAHVSKDQLTPERAEIDLRLFVELCEIELSQIKKEEKEQRLKDYIQELLSVKFPSEYQSVAWHFIGKWSAKVGDLCSAKRYLKMETDMNKQAYGALFQLSKVCVDSGEDTEAKAYMVSILEAYKAGNKIPFSIVLSAYELVITRDIFADLRSNYVDEDILTFSGILNMAMATDGVQYYQSLRNVSGYLAHVHSEFFKSVCEKIPLPISIEQYDSMRFVYIGIYLNLLRYAECSDEYKQQICAKLSPYLAMTYANKDRDRKILIDYYSIVDDADRVIRVYETIDNKEDAFVCQSMAKYYIKKDIRKALNYINISEHNIGDVNKPGQKSSVYHDKAIILDAMNDSTCLKYWDMAIHLQTTTKSKELWLLEYETAKAKYMSLSNVAGSNLSYED